MNRRNALKNIGFSVGSLTVTPALASIFNSCQSEIDWKPSFFSKDQIQFISDMLDIVLPKTTDLPGAKELNVSRFIDTYANLSMDEKTKFRVSYNFLKSASKAFEATPCIKRYLFNHVQSRFLQINADEWDIAALLPVEDFKGASTSQVYNDSRNKF